MSKLYLSYAFYTYLKNSVAKNSKICYNQNVKNHSGGDFMKRFDIYNGKSVAVKKDAVTGLQDGTLSAPADVLGPSSLEAAVLEAT